MCNEAVKTKIEKGWTDLLEEAQRLLAEETDTARKKELRFAVRGFKTLLKRKALLPGMWREMKKGGYKVTQKAGTDRESVPA